MIWILQEMASESTIRRLPSDGNVVLRLQSFSCWTPSDRPVLQNLNLALKRNESLLIVGPSGVGKTTFFLTLMKLYGRFEGTIEMLSDDSVMMLSQVLSFKSQISIYLYRERLWLLERR